MSVTNPETFTIQAGSVTANNANIIVALRDEGITGTYSNGVITITNANLASTTDSVRALTKMIRIAQSAGATVKYTVAT